MGESRSSLQDVVYGFMPAQILRVAVRLGLPDILGDRSRTAAELAEATGTHGPSLRRLLRALICLGVVAETGPDTYELAPEGHQLRGDVPSSIRAALLFFCSDEMWASWGQLEYTVRSGNIAWDNVHGMSVFEYMDKHPDQSNTFNSAMADRTRAVAPQIVASYDFSRFDTLVDVGGGNGQLIATILAAAPTLRGVLFDHPAGIEAARDTLRTAGVTDRCAVVGGDFFESVPEGGHAYLLKSVLHNWNDDQAATILRNCRAAMPADGTLLVIDRVLPQRLEPGMPGRIVYSDINMLVNTHGRERTEADFRALYSAAGFELTDVIGTSDDPVDYQLVVGEPR